MSQVFDTGIVRSDKYYQREIAKYLEKIRLKNENMERTQKEIDAMTKESAKMHRRLDKKIKEMEDMLR
ncbi:MAG: hypothetical protein KF855_08425 [Acidobacteria bacterium]|nr:hypothetical protein [Acidobacteriota bacterium]